MFKHIYSDWSEKEIQREMMIELNKTQKKKKKDKKPLKSKGILIKGQRESEEKEEAKPTEVPEVPEPTTKDKEEKVIDWKDRFRVINKASPWRCLKQPRMKKRILPHMISRRYMPPPPRIMTRTLAHNFSSSDDDDDDDDDD